MSFARSGRHRVAVLVRPGLLPMELGIVHRLFGEARSTGGRPLYEVLTCTPEPGDLPTEADFTVRVEQGPRILPEADTVVIPAANEDYEDRRSPALDEPLADALARLRPDARIASICTGAFVLAAAGLLDGRRATTHWKSAAQFRRLHPRVTLDPDVLYTEDGPVLTSAGVAAGVDLCLHMIRRDHGAAVANEVARGTVVPPHRAGGQAQFVRRPVPEPSGSSTGTARSWALHHLDRLLTLDELAARESMSVRTFTRRFRDEVGISPSRWLTQQRVERARQLLEETDLPVERIAIDTGFGTAASMRQHFGAALGTSPSAYRGTFRAAATAAPTTSDRPARR